MKWHKKIKCKSQRYWETISCELKNHSTQDTYQAITVKVGRQLTDDEVLFIIFGYKRSKQAFLTKYCC